MKLIKTLALTAFLLVLANQALARDQIRVVGSSTVYPFLTIAAEEFGKTSSFKTPIVESTGTGGGFKLFCAGKGTNHPDFANASRTVKDSERQLCAKNGVKELIEIKLGYDGIVLANATSVKRYKLTTTQLFNALAQRIEKDGELIDNPHRMWNDIDASLPEKEIEIYGPPPTSGTRDAFVELVLEPVCIKLAAFKAAYPDKKIRKKICHAVREDGSYIEVGENDNLIVQKLRSNTNALGIFGYSFLEQNTDLVQGSIINDVEPSYEAIADGHYAISRPLYTYAKKANIGSIPGIKEFVLELISDKAIGSEGYLTFKGLVPLPEKEFESFTENVKKAVN